MYGATRATARVRVAVEKPFAGASLSADCFRVSSADCPARTPKIVDAIQVTSDATAVRCHLRCIAYAPPHGTYSATANHASHPAAKKCTVVRKELHHSR